MYTDLLSVWCLVGVNTNGYGSTWSSLHAVLWRLCKFCTPHHPKSCFVVYVEPLPVLERTWAPFCSSKSPSPIVHCMRCPPFPFTFYIFWVLDLTVCEHQYLWIFFHPLIHTLCLHCQPFCVCAHTLSSFTDLRYATHWLIVFGMWISGGYQRTLRDDYRK